MKAFYLSFLVLFAGMSLAQEHVDQPQQTQVQVEESPSPSPTPLPEPEVVDVPDESLLDGFVSGLVDQIPAKTIAWVLAILALLNGLAIALEKLIAMTPTTVDDKALEVLKKALKYANSAINFILARRSDEKKG